MARYVSNRKCYDALSLSIDKVKECDGLITTFVAGLDPQQKQALRSSTSNDKALQDSQARAFLVLHGAALWQQDSKEDPTYRTTNIAQLLRNKAISIQANEGATHASSSSDKVNEGHGAIDNVTTELEDDDFDNDDETTSKATTDVEESDKDIKELETVGDAEPNDDGPVPKHFKQEPTAEIQVSPVVWKHSLSPNIIYHTTVLIRNLQSPHSKPAHLHDCMTSAAFVNTIHRLWNFDGGAGEIKGISCKMQKGEVDVILSEDVEVGHKIMMDMIGEWWAERVGLFAYHCFAHVTVTV